MNRPYLIALPARDRRRLCPCGAVADRPGALCRKCSARLAWRRKITRKTIRENRRAARWLARRRLAAAVCLIGAIIAEGVES